MIGAKFILSLTALASAAQAYSAPSQDLIEFSKKSGLPDAFLEAASGLHKRDDVPYACHANCGYLIYAAQACAQGDSYDESCMCTAGSDFNSYLDGCLDCGWCLYDNYFPSLTKALAVCGDSTTPTGTSCAPSATSTSASETSTSDAATTTTSEPPAESTAEPSTGASSAAETSTGDSSAAETSTGASSAAETSTGTTSAAESSAVETSAAETSASVTAESVSSISVFSGEGVAFGSGASLVSVAAVFAGLLALY